MDYEITVTKKNRPAVEISYLAGESEVKKFVIDDDMSDNLGRLINVSRAAFELEENAPYGVSEWVALIRARIVEALFKQKTNVLIEL